MLSFFKHIFNFGKSVERLSKDGGKYIKKKRVVALEKQVAGLQREVDHLKGQMDAIFKLVKK